MNGQRVTERGRIFSHCGRPSAMKGPRETDFAYQAVYRYLASLINESEGDSPIRLPSLRHLAERLNVSISTIQYAL
jgi:DNA-binding GntR family transcriptional regulator